MSLEILVVNTIELTFNPVSCMFVALVSGEGALTMEAVSFKGTSESAIGDDKCSLAMCFAIFPLSDVVAPSIDSSAESGQLPIHE